MTQRRAKLNLTPDGRYKPPPKHSFEDDVDTGDPPTASNRDRSDNPASEPPRPWAASNPRQDAPEGANADPSREDSPPSETGGRPAMALPPAARRLLRHPAVRVGLVGAAAALSIWLLRRRLF